MARFLTVLTNAGASLLMQALALGAKVDANVVEMGDGRFDGKQADLVGLVSPVKVNAKIADRQFVPADGDNPPLCQISVQTFNDGLKKPAYIREIGLFASGLLFRDFKGDWIPHVLDNEGNWDSMVQDENGEWLPPEGAEANPVLFAYAWLDGPDYDNVLPPPLYENIYDTIHTHEMALFVTNQENAAIEVSFAFNGFVSHRHLDERLAKFESLKDFSPDKYWSKEELKFNAPPLDFFASPVGNDDNDGESPERAVKTINRMNELFNQARDLNKSGWIRFYLAQGNYEGQFSLHSYGGKVDIIGSNSNTVAPSMATARDTVITADRTAIWASTVGHVYIDGVTCVATGNLSETSGIIDLNFTNSIIRRCIIRDDSPSSHANSGGITINNTLINMGFGEIEINNCRMAVYCRFASKANIRSITGTGNVTGYFADGGIITCIGSMPESTTPITESNGGKVFPGHLMGVNNTITIHVSPAGNDHNWGESAANAVRTLKRAVEIAARIENTTGRTIIQLTPGDYRESQINIGGIANLAILGNNAEPLNTRIFTESGGSWLMVNDCTCTINHLDLVASATISANSALIYATGRARVSMNNCNIRSEVLQTNSHAMLAIYSHIDVLGSNTRVVEGFPSLFRSEAGSRINVLNMTGSSTGINAYHSIDGEIYVQGNNIPKGAITGTTPHLVKFSYLMGFNNTITIHVSPDGDDLNWGQNVANAIRTLARARDIVQRCEGTGRIQISFANGTYEYEGAVVFTGISRHIVLFGNENSVYLRIDGDDSLISFRGCPSFAVQDISITRINRAARADASIIEGSRSNGDIIRCNLSTEQPSTNINRAGVRATRGNVYIDRCSFSNFGSALEAVYAGNIKSSNLSGSGNATGLHAFGGIILHSGNRPGATTPNIKAVGGQISDNGVWI